MDFKVRTSLSSFSLFLLAKLSERAPSHRTSATAARQLSRAVSLFVVVYKNSKMEKMTKLIKVQRKLKVYIYVDSHGCDYPKTI